MKRELGNLRPLALGLLAGLTSWLVGAGAAQGQPQRTGAAIHYVASSFGGVFLAPTATIRPLIPDALTSVEVVPGLTFVLAYCGHFDAAGPVAGPERPATYNEFALQVPVLDLYGDPVQAFTVPVIAVDELGATIGVGRVAGFPKFLARIDIVETESGFVCTVNADGEQVATLSGGSTPVGPPSPRRFRFYNARPSGVLVTSETEGIAVQGTSNVPGDATLVLGDHPSVAGFVAAGVQPSSISSFYNPLIDQVLTLFR